MSRRLLLCGLALAAASVAPVLAQRVAIAHGIFEDAVAVRLEVVPFSDTRFFGTYCLPAPKEFCKDIPAFPDPCKTVNRMTVHLELLTTRKGAFVRGGGPIFIENRGTFLSVAGNVVERGKLRFAGSIPGLDHQAGEATLSEDGLALTAKAQNRTLTLRKDACGNSPPRVTLNAPFGPSFRFGESVMLAGQIQDEDTQFPVERLVFTSNRQGILSGTRTAGGRTLFTTSLVPGNHRVTLTVTDSGGLTAQSSIDLTILNRPPDVPKIVQPAANANVPAGVPVLLRGTAFDPDSGRLPGSALSWSAQLAPGGAFVALGTGNELTTVFAAPADPVLIRLTAADSTAQQNHVDQLVRVVAGTGNAPPHVAIREPDPLSQNGLLIGGATVGFPAHFLATASDVEDAPNQLQLRWQFTALQNLGGDPNPSPPAPNPAPITGTLAPEVMFGSGNTFYRVTFTATDSAGQSSSESIEIHVIGSVIL